MCVLPKGGGVSNRRKVMHEAIKKKTANEQTTIPSSSLHGSLTSEPISPLLKEVE